MTDEREEALRLAKRCNRCGVLKGLEHYQKHSGKGHSDGRDTQCKACRKLYNDARNQDPARKATLIQRAAEYREHHPKSRKAQSRLRAAVRDGRVQKYPCFVCGSESEAHHPDYDQPLSVVWLCRQHHRDAHAIAKRLDP